MDGLRANSPASSYESAYNALLILLLIFLPLQ